MKTKIFSEFSVTRNLYFKTKIYFLKTQADMLFPPAKGQIGKKPFSIEESGKLSNNYKGSNLFWYSKTQVNRHSYKSLVKKSLKLFLFSQKIIKYVTLKDSGKKDSVKTVILNWVAILIWFQKTKSFCTISNKYISS